MAHRTLPESTAARRAFGMATLAVLMLALLPNTTADAKKPDKDSKSLIKNLQPYLNESGFLATYNVGGDIDTRGAFFQDFGTNGRTCATCHQASQAFSFSSKEARRIFLQTKGRDPLFAAVDGANCPNAETGNYAAHSLIVGSGLIRVSIAAPTSSPEFTLQAEHDPYGCAIDGSTGQDMLSFYRRPLPSTNLRFLSAVMFDARETVAPLSNPSTVAANLITDLTSQAKDAILGHSQAQALPPADQIAEIVNFELGLSTAQTWSFGAGSLAGDGALGGPLNLAQVTYYPGINDSLTPSIFTPKVFALYGSWENSNDSHDSRNLRAEIAAGEKLFDSFPINITSVRGLNDNPLLGNPAVITGTCGTCHDAPGVGDHSMPLPLDIGTGHAAAYETDPQIKAALAQLSFPDLPVYKVTGCNDPFTGDSIIYTTDLGKAALTGKCVDMNRVKGPVLRGLAARAPYFHNGSAATLDEAVNFYNERFKMGLTKLQKAQLVAFLKSL